MHTHILIPTDGSDLSDDAIQYGVALASAVNAKVTGMTVSSPSRAPALDRDAAGTTESHDELLPAEAARRLARVKDAAAAAGVDCEVLHVEHDHPYRAIIDAAEGKGCDLIVMASHGRRGLSAILLGSETLKVLTHSAIPVLVHRVPRAGLFPPYFAAS